MLHHPLRATAPQQPPASVGQLRIDYGADEAGVVCRVGGEIDYDAANQLREAVDAAVGEAAARPHPAPRKLWIDTTAVTFCDSTGLNGLLRAHSACRSQGVELVLVPGECVLRLLELTDTKDLFAIAPAPPTPRQPALRSAATG
ncbi:MAG TPA: STAS domain-containing protein [Yinghuangia sp.]|uniref:STAS domain-containing protein n=1 Tax=Yinghuangia sp. YIM S10712 TaxID=3436930 RepID=UPI002C6EB38D|nr:STAS domain-containing protein [Yinghuangia sp.]